MGAVCSSHVGKAVELPHGADYPSRPAYLPCDLVSPPNIERIGIRAVDLLTEQAAQFAKAVCVLNDSLNGLLLDARLCIGMLQGGFTLSLLPSKNVDIFSFELLTASGRPLEMAEAARLRGRDLRCNGKLAVLDAQLAQCLEALADLFVSKVGVSGPFLMLSPIGNLVMKSQDEPLDPVVKAFNGTMLDMRSTLGSDYLLALHLHKAQAHGLPAFRVRLLKTSPETSDAAPCAPLTAAAVPSGCQLATLLDLAACLNASHLADAMHAFHDANSRLAMELKLNGLTCPLAVVSITPRTVGLADSVHSFSAHPPHAPPTISSPPLKQGTSIAALNAANATNAAVKAAVSPRDRKLAHSSRSGTHRATDPMAVAATALRHLPHSARMRVTRAVDGLNAAVHSLAHAAAAAPGPANFAALLTHVLGELRDVVAAAGGNKALESYQPSVHFVGGGDSDPSLEFKLDPHLPQMDGAAREGGGAAGTLTRTPPAFPDCLSLPVRRAWLLLQELLRVHQVVVQQLQPLRHLAEAFEEGLRRRSASLPQDAAAAGMSLAQAAEAGRALLRNHVELRDCWQGALEVLTSTSRLVRDEMAEAAQLARVQCSFMSPMAWSISIASTSIAAASGSGATGSIGSPLSASTNGLSSQLHGTISSYASSLSGPPNASNLSGSIDAGGCSDITATSTGRLHRKVGGGGGTSIRTYTGGASVATSLATSFEAVVEVGEGLEMEERPLGRVQQCSTPNKASVDYQQQSASTSALQPHSPSRARSAMVMSGLETPVRLPQPKGTSPSRINPAASALTSNSGGSFESPPRMIGRAFSRSAVSCSAAESGGSPQRSGAYPANRTKSPGGERSSKRWILLDVFGSAGSGSSGGGGGGGGGGHMGQRQDQGQGSSPMRLHRLGRESLADEYARAALAHLQLQDKAV